jgi:uncharacterized membrane protein
MGAGCMISARSEKEKETVIMSLWFYILAQLSILAYALIGGVFLAFSDFIMRSLANTTGSGGIAAMQTINREVFRWIFMTLFIGLVPVSAILAGYGLVALPQPAGLLVALAGGLYIAACFGTTALFNVPLNNALADMEPSGEATVEFWNHTYLPRWTFWNSVRAMACVASSALLLIALLAMSSIRFA